ncbi:branched-chain amino acid ABC transporter permease [Pseudoroseomonas wenyumeiae]|uniref:Branched-chain amino acid ABC transporter permease n=1 Tax=Teichococcus wenyumeiae TaxID=2478470 RepID=A0A3A9JKC7_9PROT|nr:branched-chain amino acid ABC transporter permease [Pseudoroseomonas wenyumeiae]RKK05243.1 branched-chain amino acid ABC transporter permease [Pseudoroseomonas wenyumeiae]RMI19887.1 branched-chain amino acid ABC transporter permease [Pseudoroseomonas wenyumeiae]
MIAYLLNLATLATVFGILAASLNLLIGYAGIFSIAHAVFFGIGAYTGAQLAILFIPDVLLACLAGGLLAGALSLCLALPALRVRGEYFVAASLGLQMMAVTLFSEAHVLTGGHGGLVGIPLPTLFGIDISAPATFLLFCLLVLACVLLAIRMLMRGSFGRALMAIRDSESAAEAFGKDVPRLKTLAVALGCTLAGVAGALFAFYMAFVNVESFTLEQSILVMAMVIIGGTATLAGPLVGVLLLLLLPAALSFLPFIPATQIGAVQQLIYGAAMTLLMIFRPAGLAGQSTGRR